MATNRRQFLQRVLGGSTLLSAGLTAPTFLASTARSLAARGSSGQSVLVVLQLSGGNDGLNTVIPYRDPLYARNRVALRIAGGSVVPLEGGIGLHPQMRAMADLYEQGLLGIAQGVGYPNPNRSHFESMDIWHSCQRGEQAESGDSAMSRPRTGWLGRMLDRLPQRQRREVPALHLGRGSLPLALVARQTAVPSIDALDRFQLRTPGGGLTAAALREMAASSHSGEGRADAALAPGGSGSDSLAQFVQQTTLTALDASDKLQASLEEGIAAASYPALPLAGQLRTVAQLIDAGLPCRIYYLSLGGFDTHASQAPAHAALLSQLSQSLGAFMADIQARGHGDRVLVMTFSEFGRRVKENASSGTDHGAAAPMFLAGLGAKPGLLGPHPPLDDLDAGDLKHHTDFRQVYAAVLEHWLDCPAAEVLGGNFRPADVIRVNESS